MAVLGRRPNTSLPSVFFNMNSDGLAAMDDASLLRFADETLGIAIPRGTKRSILISKITNAAVSCKDVA